MNLLDEITKNDKVVDLDTKSKKIITDFFNQHKEYYSLGGIKKIEEDGDFYFVVSLYGGKNGNGNWDEYLTHLHKLFVEFDYTKSGIKDVWMIKLINDCLDDVHTVFIGLVLK